MSSSQVFDKMFTPDVLYRVVYHIMRLTETGDMLSESNGIAAVTVVMISVPLTV